MSLDVAFIGAGAINFGGAEGPWDHATRLEKIGGVNVVAIVDPLVDKATKVLEARKSGANGSIYASCKVYTSMDSLLASRKVSAVFIGTPPMFRGCVELGLELQCLKAGINLFVEKPLSVTPPENFEVYSNMIAQEVKSSNKVLSVGYMFRYHSAVLKMKELIRENGGKVMAYNGRYYLAYTEMDHPFWWDINKSGGPIVEQATHFLDLARYLAGDVVHQSISTACLRESDKGGAGVLGHVQPGMEDKIAVQDRIPRVTVSNWRFEEGGVGSLMHVVGLHGKRYETQIEILMDGLRLTLYEPYHPECKLLVRRSGSDVEEVYNFGDADPYDGELRAFLEAVKTGDQSGIASSYADAAKTYMFSWAVRRAGEKSGTY